jgi:hypothetical protein
MKTDVAALGRCNGMDEMDRQGSYVKLVYHHKGENHHLVISEGCAENLIGELQGALDQKDERKPFPPGTRVIPAE